MEESIKASIKSAQTDMFKSYANGSFGIFVSGMVWLTSAVTAILISDKNAMWVLFIGGMLIHPLSILGYKLMGLPGAHTKGNPLATLAMEGTIWMIMTIPLAFGVSLLHQEWFFQAMLLIIGGRYLTFSSIYGNRLYWLLGLVLALASYLLFRFQVQPSGSALTGSLIEITFGLTMLITFRKTTKDKVSIN